MAKQKVDPRNNSEAFFWESYQFRIVGEQLQHLVWLNKGPGIPVSGWYISHVRPATGQEQNMYEHIEKEETRHG